MGRPVKPLISREGAARAALAVIDAQGLESLSLELVARQLGVKAPSLYYHFNDKAELLAEVARLIFVDAPVPPPLKGCWEENLVRLCTATRRSILQHPNAAPLLLQFFPRRLLLKSYDHSLKDVPYAPSLHLLVLECAEKLTFGSALFEASARARGIDAMPAIDPERYPLLARAIKANPTDEETLFIELLRTFLAGLKALHEVKSPQPVAKKAPKAPLPPKNRVRAKPRQTQRAE